MLSGLSTKLVDTTDKSLQADPKFPPDKEPLWKYPREADGWVHAHNAIREELKEIKSALEALASQQTSDAQVRALKAIFEIHYIHVVDHHYNEDKVVGPTMMKRINLPSKLTTDHTPLHAYLDKLRGMFNQLKAGDSVKDILTTWKAYSEDMCPHLMEEEMVALPLARAYFTPKEFSKIIAQIMKSVPPIALGAFLYWLDGKQGEKAAVNKFMKQEGIPWFVYHLQFKKAIRTYKKQFIDPIEALKKGGHPAPEEKKRCC